MSPRRRKIIYTMIVVAFGLLIMTIGVVIGMNLKSNINAPKNEVENDQDNNQGIDVGEPNPNTPTDENEDETPVAPANRTEFESSRYNIKFSYPDEFGQHQQTVDTLYFFGEQVTFPNSNIQIGYTRYEGSAGMTTDNVKQGEVNTKQGYTGSYYIYTNPNGFTLFVRVPSPGSNGNGVVITSTASTQSGAEAELVKVQEILNTIEFDFSNVPLNGCETSCK
jgi:hypothetical protein